MQFEVVKTNIVNIVADAIVLPANKSLKEGSGTSRAIFEAAGRKALTKACDKIKHCETGNAVPTLAFDLSAKYIIHAVVPRWVEGESGEYDLLSSAYLSSLNIADIMGCESRDVHGQGMEKRKSYGDASADLTTAQNTAPSHRPSKKNPSRGRL